MRIRACARRTVVPSGVAWVAVRVPYGVFGVTLYMSAVLSHEALNILASRPLGMVWLKMLKASNPRFTLTRSVIGKVLVKRASVRNTPPTFKAERDSHGTRPEPLSPFRVRVLV